MGEASERLRTMSVASVEIQRPQEDDGEDLILPEARRGTAQHVIYGVRQLLVRDGPGSHVYMVV